VVVDIGWRVVEEDLPIQNHYLELVDLDLAVEVLMLVGVTELVSLTLVLLE
jgi:hypothetical protein